MTRDINEICRVMCLTAKSAGRIMHGTNPADVGITQKPGTANYVTECDVAVQKFIARELSVFSPEIGFFGEEDTEKGKLISDLAFVVDPIDGTSNFMMGLRLSAVSIALCDVKANRTLAAAVYCPYTDELFWATLGGGAYLNGEPMQVSARDLEHGLAGYGSTPYDRTVADRHMALLSRVYAKCIDVRNLGTAALHLAYVAAGRLCAFYELRLSPWDYAAGALLITEAGGKITNFSGDPLDLSAPDSVMAGNPVAYAELKELIEE